MPQKVTSHCPQMSDGTPQGVPIPRIFSAKTIDSILVAFVLRFSAFPDRDTESRIQIRFVFQLFLQQQITIPLFLQICEHFDATIVSQARILSQTLTDPWSMVTTSGQGQMWTDQETLLLLSLTFLNLLHLIPEMMPGRSPDACRGRIKRVVRDLEIANMFSDLAPGRVRVCSLTSSTVISLKDARQERRLRRRRLQARAMRSKKSMRKRLLHLKTSNMRLKKSLKNLQQTLDEFEHSLQEKGQLSESDAESDL